VVVFGLRYRKRASSTHAKSDADLHVWDTDLHLPPWIPDSEKAMVEALLDGWASKLHQSQTGLITEACHDLTKPLRPLWVSDGSVIWRDAVPDPTRLEFTPMYLVSASKCAAHPALRPVAKFSNFSWKYIHGAGDDHESWCRGLTPTLFWKNRERLLCTDPEFTDDIIEDIVAASNPTQSALVQMVHSCKKKDKDPSSSGEDDAVAWVGRSIGVAPITYFGSVELPATHPPPFDAVVNCSSSLVAKGVESLLLAQGIPLQQALVENHKYNRFSLQNGLKRALPFSLGRIGKGERVLIVCDDGRDIAPCVAAAIHWAVVHNHNRLDGCDLDAGDNAKEPLQQPVSKDDVRDAVAYVSRFCPSAHPTRGSIKQVYNFLRDREKESSTLKSSGVV